MFTGSRKRERPSHPRNRLTRRCGNNLALRTWSKKPMPRLDGHDLALTSTRRSWNWARSSAVRSRLNVPLARSGRTVSRAVRGVSTGCRVVGRDPRTPLRYAAFVACAKGQVLVRQRAEGVVNAGLWEFPNLDITNTPEASPVDLASACFGFSVPQVELLCSIQHTITRYRIRLDAYWIEANAKTFKVIPNAGAWLPYEIQTQPKSGEVDFEDMRLLMLEVGAIETPAGVRLRYPNAEMAADAYARLSEEMPEAHWSIVETVGAVNSESL